MNVEDLIEELELLDPELDVVFSYNYGDHWRTVVAMDVSTIEEGIVIHSDYHSMPKVIDEDDDKHNDDKSRRNVIILS